MKGLTERQKQILRWLIRYTEANGYQPCLREIGEAHGMKAAWGLRVHIDALSKKGYINVNENTPRAISVIRDHEGRRGSFRWIHDATHDHEEGTL
jgi:repressor LexA